MKGAELAEILKKHKDAIVQTWARDMRKSLDDYRSRPYEELVQTTSQHVEAFIRALETGEEDALRSFLGRLAKMRSDMDFHLSQTLRAMIVGREAVTLALEESFPDNLPVLLLGMRRLDELFYESVYLYSDVYQQVKVDEAREHTRALARAEAEAKYLDVLRRSERLAAVGMLAAGIAHEIGTPLNIISGRAELLAQQTAPGSSARKDLDVILKQIDRITGLLQQILDFTRSHRQQKQVIPLSQPVTQALGLLEREIKRKGVHLLVELPQPSPMVEADVHQIEQVVVNLLVNALQASQDDGTIRLSVKTSTAGMGKKMARLEVEDTGSGIPEVALSRIFDPFFTTRSESGGTGLGLAISRNIVEDHGGYIEVHSQVGRGTLFVVSLPTNENGGLDG